MRTCKPQPDDFFFSLIGQGFRLRVPHNKDEGASLEDGIFEFIRQERRQSIPIERDAARRFIESGWMHKMDRDDINGRGGWKNSGLDGDVADFYCMVI